MNVKVVKEQLKKVEYKITRHMKGFDQLFTAAWETSQNVPLCLTFLFILICSCKVNVYKQCILSGLRQMIFFLKLKNIKYRIKC